MLLLTLFQPGAYVFDMFGFMAEAVFGDPFPQRLALEPGGFRLGQFFVGERFDLADGLLATCIQRATWR